MPCAYTDYVKMDHCGLPGTGNATDRQLYGAMSSALNATGRPITFSLCNWGEASVWEWGAEVAQLYLSFPPNAGEPPRQLKGFKKIELAPGASATIDITLTPRELSIWSTSSHKWEVAKGTFGVHVGSSSRDVRLAGTFTV